MENEVNGIQAGKKNVPPEAAAASPIHRNYQPAGQLHIMRLTAEEQPGAPDFFPAGQESVWNMDIPRVFAGWYWRM